MSIRRRRALRPRRRRQAQDGAGNRWTSCPCPRPCPCSRQIDLARGPERNVCGEKFEGRGLRRRRAIRRRRRPYNDGDGGGGVRKVRSENPAGSCSLMQTCACGSLTAATCRPGQARVGRRAPPRPPCANSARASTRRPPAARASCLRRSSPVSARGIRARGHATVVSVPPFLPADRRRNGRRSDGTTGLPPSIHCCCTDGGAWCAMHHVHGATASSADAGKVALVRSLGKGPASRWLAPRDETQTVVVACLCCVLKSHSSATRSPPYQQPTKESATHSVCTVLACSGFVVWLDTTVFGAAETCVPQFSISVGYR